MDATLRQKILEIIHPIENGALVRLGNNYDGGYVLSKKLLSQTNSLVTLGVNNEWSFESDFIRKYKGDVLMIDDKYSSFSNLKCFILTVLTLVKPIRILDKIERCKYWWGLNRTFIASFIVSKFRMKYKRHFVSSIDSEEAIRIKTLWSKYRLWKGNQDVLLKIDIEGSEYDCISGILEVKASLSGLLIEFHSILDYPQRFLQSMEILKEHFFVEHVHYNNYSNLEDGIADVIELSMISKTKCIGNLKYSEQNFPILGVDFPNKKGKEDYQIPLLWNE